jgi:hypothetical protein
VITENQMRLKLAQTLKRESLKSNGQQFRQYQQKRTTTSHLKSLNTKNQET